jgi:hypothetical protein
VGLKTLLKECLPSSNSMCSLANWPLPLIRDSHEHTNLRALGPGGDSLGHRLPALVEAELRRQPKGVLHQEQLTTVVVDSVLDHTEPISVPG